MTIKGVSLIVDMSHLAYRVFFISQNIEADFGVDVLIQGVLNSFRSLIKKFEGMQLFLVWDRGYTRKRELYAGYKRKSEIMTPEQRQKFTSQIAELYDFLQSLGLKCCWQEGVEADDVMAALVNKARVRVQGTNKYIPVTFPAIIVSEDHDLNTLLRDGEVLLWKANRNVLYASEDFRQDFGVEPSKYAEMQALMGCSSDKVPGVRGIGPKSAAALIKRFGSLSAIKDAPDKDRLVSLVQHHWEDAELSFKLVSFEPVDPVAVCLPPDLSRVRKLLFKWEMFDYIEDWGFVESLSEL